MAVVMFAVVIADSAAIVFVVLRRVRDRVLRGDPPTLGMQDTVDVGEVGHDERKFVLVHNTAVTARFKEPAEENGRLTIFFAEMTPMKGVSFQMKQFKMDNFSLLIQEICSLRRERD